MKLLFILYIYSILFVFNVHGSNSADTSKTIEISSIVIIGNETTEDHIILRELDFEPGDLVSEFQLTYNQERVFSLGIFNRVEFTVDKVENRNLLIIRIEESWYIYPLPYLELRENSFKRSSYGLGILYKNFRGRNETLWALATFGYDPTYLLDYMNPVLVTGKNLTFGLKLGYTNLDNRNISSEILYGGHFRYNYIYGSVSLGYRFDQFNFATIAPTFEYLEMPKQVSSLSASNEDIDRILALSFLYQYDDRNLKQFSNDGLFGTVDYTHKGFGIDNISYNVFTLDVRKYNLIFGDLFGKWRGLFRSTFGSSIPFYALSLLGDQEYIRGHRFNKREGNNYFLTSFEFNYPIIKEWNLSLDLPIFPRSLTSARIGLYTNIFFDTGTTFNNDESPQLSRLDSGWGFGVTLLVLPYNALRFEYALNESSEGEFILATGFSF